MGLAAALPSIGTLSYNGFTFNNSTRSSVRGRLLYDRAERTVIGTVYTFFVSTFIFEATPGAGCDDQVEDLRQKLSHAGGEFRYQAKGFGDFEVNVGGNRDIQFGPRPRIVALDPVGGPGCWRLDWVCEVTVP